MSDLKKQLDVDVIQSLRQIEKYQKYGIEPLNGILGRVKLEVRHKPPN